MSSEIQESLSHFKVIVACNRLDYFERKFGEVNQENFRASITSGVASNLFTPLYAIASTAAQLVTLVYGIHLIQ
jgi:ATP-binding cassette subfamily B protein